MFPKVMRRKSIDFLVVYERKNRELENAILLQLELERRGYSCVIAQYYEAKYFNFFNYNAPKIIIVPHLYDSGEVARIVARYGRPNVIINLQYEQVLSEKWECHGHHNPKGLALQCHHICWGWKTVDRLRCSGVPPEYIHLLGALQLDLLRVEYANPASSREYLSRQYGLSSSKRWNIFLSSFTYADISDDRLKMNEAVAGTDLSSFVEIHTRSRDEILKWFEQVMLKDPDSIFIYRPHPDELSLDKVLALQDYFDNFVVISDGAAKLWIEASDRIYSWYSTTVVESHFMNKAYSILRPFKLPSYFDSVLLRHGKFIESYDEFELAYVSGDNDRDKAIEDQFVNMYYKTDNVSPSFVLLCDLLESLTGKGFFLPRVSFPLVFGFKVKSFLVAVVYFMYIRNGFLFFNKFGKLKSWFDEFDAQFSSSKERDFVKNAILHRINKE